MSSRLAKLVESQRVVVCCGAGGVGKTSVAAALSVAGARAKRRVLVVTVDPSRRLAQALGVDAHSDTPIAISAENLAALGVEGGTVDAWMLDPQVVSDSVVRRLSASPEEADKLMQNRIYKNVAKMVAGMQEYTAVEAMHGFVKDDRYDLVILDTPPSRNALHFLEAPGRINRFLDGRIFRFFLPTEGGMVSRAATRATEKLMDLVFGQESRLELMTFFAAFAQILKRLNHNATDMQAFFRGPQVSFVLVTSPAQEALEEAKFFEKKTQDELELTISGYVLNRSQAERDGRVMPDSQGPSGVSPKAWEAFRLCAEREQAEMTRHQSLLGELHGGLKSGGFALATPHLAQGVSTLEDLGLLASKLSDPAPESQVV